MNQQTLRILEFDQIKEALREFTSSGLGARLVEELAPSSDPAAVRHRLRETTEARAILEEAGQIGLAGLVDLSESLERAERGAVLDPASLQAMGDFLRGCRKTKSLMARYRDLAPQVSAYAASLTDLPELEAEIERCVEDSRISSRASAALERLRKQIAVTQSRLKDKVDSCLASPRYRECLQETVVSLRDGRYCLAVKASCRHRVEGTLHGSSGSGQTVFIEPAAVKALADELRILESKAEAEEYQILSRLTGEVGARLQAIRLNQETMAVYDFTLAKARYSRSVDGVPAAILATPEVRIRGGRHPLLGRNAIPLDFQLPPGCRVLIVTGPNTGGKTVALKTIGLFALMTQSGLHVPAAGAEIGVFTQVLADIGDRQSIEQSLSTFSGHMRNIVAIMAAAGRDTLVLLDEIGTGTDPAEGAALAAAVLQDLCAAGALVAATTHYGDLKRLAEEHKGFANGCMEFDPETLQPLFRLVIGRPGRSNGLWIAERLGMGRGTLEKARAFLGANGRADPRSLAGEPDRKPTPAMASDAADRAYGPVSGMPWDASRPAAGTGAPGEAKQESPAAQTPGAHAAQDQPDRPYRIGDLIHLGSLGENGVLCELPDARGNVVVLVKGKKVKINQKRIKLKMPMEELYPDPEQYDLDIVLLSKDDRRLVKAMRKRHVEGAVRIIDKK